MHIVLLNTAFEIDIDTPEPLRYIESFMSAYAASQQGLQKKTSSFQVTARAQPVNTLLTDPASAAHVPIHITKHDYWTIDGLRNDNGSGWLVWQRRGVATKLDDDHLIFAYSPAINAIEAGEALFHALRGIAIARRSHDPFLHASCVTVDGRAMAFVGEVLAGKTTLMTELVLNSRASPLSNDRIQVVRGQDGFHAFSWPSYSSYCEGTLLNYPVLEKQAIRYENGELPYKTQSWGRSLANSFDKSTKRIYPMEWFSTAGNKKFIPSAPLSLVLFPRLIHGGHDIAVEAIDDAASFTELMTGNAFLGDDPSFKPWHGLLRSRSADLEKYDEFCSSFLRQGGKAATISIPVTQISAFPEVFEKLCCVPA